MLTGVVVLTLAAFGTVSASTSGPAGAATSFPVCAPNKFAIAPGYRLTPVVTHLPSEDGASVGGVQIGGGCVGALGFGFSPSGQLYVADSISGGVYRFGPSGGTASTADEILHPLQSTIEQLDFNRNGDLFVSQMTSPGSSTGGVLQIDPSTGRVLRTVASGLTCPDVMTADPTTGDLFVDGDCYGGISTPDVWRVHVSPHGKPSQSVFLVTPSPTNTGAAVTPSGELYLDESAGFFRFHAGTARSVRQSSGKAVTVPGLAKPGLGNAAVPVLAPGGDGNVLYVFTVHRAFELDLSTSPPTETPIITHGYAYWSPVFGPDGCIYISAGSEILRLSHSDGSCLLAGAVAPSTIASGLISLSTAVRPLSAVAAGAGLTAFLGLVLTFPSSLFNSTYTENEDEIRESWRRRTAPVRERWRRVRSQLGRRPGGGGSAVADHPAGPASEAPHRPEWLKFSLVLLVGALLSCFNDPTFGTGLGSLLTFSGVLLSMVVGIAIPTAVAELYHRGRTEPEGRIERHLHAIPSGLLIGAGCVLFSRVVGFEPGYLYGVIVGVLYAKDLAKNEKGHLAALTAMSVVLVSFVAWLCWAPVNRAATQPGAFVLLVLLDNLLAAMFIGGMVGTVIGMIPLRVLPGFTIREWRRSAWAAILGVALFLVVAVMLRPDTRPGGPSHTPLVMTIVLFVAFGAASVVFHEYWEQRRRKSEGLPPETVEERVRAYGPQFRAWLGGRRSGTSTPAPVEAGVGAGVGADAGGGEGAGTGD